MATPYLFSTREPLEKHADFVIVDSMNKKMNIAVIGTGAVGGYYGAMLQRAGHAVHFLLNSDYKHVKENGLRVDSVNGDFVLPSVFAYSNARDMPECDVVIVSLKTTANNILESVLPRVLSKEAVAVVLQNGLNTDAEVAEIAGPDRVVGGLCFLCSNKLGPGHIHHLDYGLISLGEYRADGGAGGITPRLKALAELFEDAGIPIAQEADLKQARWKKLVWNIPFNGMAVVENCLTDALMKRPELRQRCTTMMHEVVAAAEACSRPLEAGLIEQMLENTEKMAPYAPSMKLDYDLGRPMELERIYGDALRAASEKDVPMPQTRHLYEQLQALDKTS